MTTILVTGGCGFIGHHFVEHLHRNTEWTIIILDKLSYASYGLKRLDSIDILHSKRIKVFTYDCSNSLTVGIRAEIGDIDYIVHMAADTHVDNSIDDPVPFIHNNVMSTVHMLEYARSLPTLKKFFYFSTDEVFGSAPDNIMYKEWDTHNPTNPYSASKSAGEQICLSYENTYNVPVIITNTMNVIGERQHVEKFVPKIIKYLLTDKKLDIHADETCTKSGSRFYIHARNVSSAVLFLINHGEIGEKYNITGECEMSNLEIAQFIAKVMNKELQYELVNFHSDRPGHDLRYALDGTKLSKMGWTIPIPFEQSLVKTIEWTLQRSRWLEE